MGEAQWQQMVMERLGRIETRLDSIGESVSGMGEAINGNGRPGLKTQVDRLQQTATAQAKVFWLVVALVVSGAGVEVARVMSHVHSEPSIQPALARP